MLKWLPAADRSRLGFKEAVISSFGYLQTYGLRCAQVNVTLVRYNSSKIFVNVYHGRGSYELNVEIGRHEGPQRDNPYALDAILGWVAAPERKLLEREKSLFQSDARDGVKDMVPKMAELFRKYADPLLRGDEEAFKSLDSYCALESRRLGEHYTAGTTRWNADMAFQRKDWQQVIELYESIGEGLSQTEAAELAYAKEQAERDARMRPQVTSVKRS